MNAPIKRLDITMSQNDKDSRICLGIITAAHGIKGEVKIKSYMEAPSDIVSYNPLTNEEETRNFTILSLHPAGKSLVARLEGITDRNEAETLRGTKLFTDRSRLPSLETAESEWYYADLIGLDIVKKDSSGNRDKIIGKVKSVQNFGAGDLIEIYFPGSDTEEFFDFSEAVFPVIDLEKGFIEYIPPSYDTAENRSQKKRKTKPDAASKAGKSPRNDP